MEKHLALVYRSVVAESNWRHALADDVPGCEVSQGHALHDVPGYEVVQGPALPDVPGCEVDQGPEDNEKQDCVFCQYDVFLNCLIR